MAIYVGSNASNVYKGSSLVSNIFINSTSVLSLSPPSPSFNFLYDTFGVQVQDINSVITHNYIPQYPATTGVTYYVDPVNGSNANNGLTAGTAKQTLSGVNALINAASTDLVHCVMFKGGLVRRNVPLQWNRSVVFKNIDGIRLKHVQAASETPISWSKTVGQVNVYEGTPTGTVNRVIDVSSSMPGYPSYAPRYYRLVSTSSISECDSTVNSFYYDNVTPKLYVHAFDSRVADGNIIQVANSTPMTFAANTGVTNPIFWIEGIDFIGTEVTITEQYVAGGNSNTRAWVNNCTAQTTSGDGFFCRGLGSWLQYRCGAYDTEIDGFSSWGLNAASNTDPAGDRVEIECRTDYCGRGVSQQTNSSTLHSLARLVSILPNYSNALDRDVHDVNSSKRWLIGGSIGPSRTISGSTSRSLQAGNANGQSTEIWVHNTVINPGSQYDLNTYSGCTIRFKNTVPPSLTIDPASAGLISTY